METTNYEKFNFFQKKIKINYSVKSKYNSGVLYIYICKNFLFGKNKDKKFCLIRGDRLRREFRRGNGSWILPL